MAKGVDVSPTETPEQGVRDRSTLYSVAQAEVKSLVGELGTSVTARRSDLGGPLR